MPSRLFHVVLLTDEIEETARFLVDVVGLTNPRWLPNESAEASRLLGWPPVREPGRRVVLGEAPGMVELVEIPVELRGTVSPGLAFTAFATPDVDGYAERAIAAGYDVERVEVLGNAMAGVEVGGLGFHLMRFA